MQGCVSIGRNNTELMKIVKSIEVKHTIIYVEDNGKYSAYKRFDKNEWYDGVRNRKVSDKELESNLEELYVKSLK
jgi:hypothetical protein